MRIGVSVDEVLRDSLSKLLELFEKYEIGEILVDSVDEITDKKNLSQYFKISEDYTDVNSFNDMLYNKYSFELFGAPKLMEENIMESINDFVFDFYATPGNEFVIFSKEFNRSIQSTYYFISKTNTSVRSINLVETYNNIWDKFDLIITAEPSIIETRPEDKVVIKINAPYNMHLDEKYNFNFISEVFQNLDLENIK